MQPEAAYGHAETTAGLIVAKSTKHPDITMRKLLPDDCRGRVPNMRDRHVWSQLPHQETSRSHKQACDANGPFQGFSAAYADSQQLLARALCAHLSVAELLRTPTYWHPKRLQTRSHTPPAHKSP
jgi:hypothetical protein